MKDRHIETIKRLKTNGITTKIDYTKSINIDSNIDKEGVKFIVDSFYESVIFEMIKESDTIILPGIGRLEKSKYVILARKMISEGYSVEEATIAARKAKYKDLTGKDIKD